MAMQKLNVRFSDNTKENILNTATNVDLNESYIARAALNLGLKHIDKVIAIGCSDIAFDKLISDNQ